MVPEKKEKSSKKQAPLLLPISLPITALVLTADIMSFVVSFHFYITWTLISFHSG